ncbi:MAG: hypothetical protein ABI597_04070 [Gammaproteobacteria bacterium]
MTGSTTANLNNALKNKPDYEIMIDESPDDNNQSVEYKAKNSRSYSLSWMCCAKKDEPVMPSDPVLKLEM